MGADKAELVVVGAGPAGLGGAIEAAEHGVQVVLVDENARPGGQLFKQIHKFFGSHDQGAGTRGFNLGSSLLDQAKKAGVEIRLNTVATGLFEGRVLALVTGDQLTTIDADNLLIATGAMENALSFPGWTLPGVMGAGAAQTMLHIHRVLPGRRVLMVGSGNVGLIVSYQLLQAGATIAAVAEALPQIGGYAVHASKLRRMGVPILTGHTIVEARGDGSVSEAVIARLDDSWQVVPGTEQVLPVDTVCLAVGLSPMGELAYLAGCRFEYSRELGGHLPWHGSDMRTSVPGIYVAGDVAGVEEASTALEEGRLAGLHIAATTGKVDALTLERRRGEIQCSLDAIRQGPFGERLRAAKQRLVGAGAVMPGKTLPSGTHASAGGSSLTAAAAPVRRDGCLSADELWELPGVPQREKFEGRRLAVLECAECIPCNPCETACPVGAIRVGSPITNLPVLDVEKCHGCGVCVAACPGLAAFVVDIDHSDTEAAVMLPYELLPLPKKGEPVRLLDRAGRALGDGRVVAVRAPKAFDRTAVVTIAIPKSLAHEVRWFERTEGAGS